jgi:hypothetical protein
MDFGIAKVVGARGTTRTGMQLGTPAYMSPEQIQGRQIDVRTDIYALGITLYQMLSGHVPFEEGSDFDIMRHQVSTPPPPMVDLHPYAPAQYQNVVTKAIAKNPDDRYRSVEEFGAALENPASVAATVAATMVEGPKRTVLDSSGSTYAAAAAAPSQTPVPPPLTTFPASPAPIVPSGNKWNSRYTMAAVIVGVAVVLLAIVLFARKPSAAPIASVGGSAGSPLSQPNVEMTASGTLNAPGGGGGGAASSGQQASDHTAGNPQQTSTPGKTKTVASNRVPDHASTEPPPPPAPAVDPKVLRDLETETEQLYSRAAAVEGSMDTLEHQMQQSGLGLRGDMVAARNSMRNDLQQAKSAIENQDTDRARHYIDLAHKDVEKLEGFLGRR